MYNPRLCNFFWGSHGCGRPVGHGIVHFCGPYGDACCVFTESGEPDYTNDYGTLVTPGFVTFRYQDEPQRWGEPMPGWTGWYGIERP